MGLSFLLPRKRFNFSFPEIIYFSFSRFFPRKRFTHVALEAALSFFQRLHSRGVRCSTFQNGGKAESCCYPVLLDNTRRLMRA